MAAISCVYLRYLLYMWLSLYLNTLGTWCICEYRCTSSLKVLDVHVAAAVPGWDPQLLIISGKNTFIIHFKQRRESGPFPILGNGLTVLQWLTPPPSSPNATNNNTYLYEFSNSLVEPSFFRVLRSAQFSNIIYYLRNCKNSKNCRFPWLLVLGQLILLSLIW